MKNFILPVFTLFILAAGGRTADGLDVASYNLRFNHLRENPENTWEMRKDRVRALLEYYAFDIVGTQEPLLDQIEYLTASLPGYAAIAVPKGDGVSNDQTCAILYKKERLELLRHGNFWHSQTPQTHENGGRITTWGKFRDRRTQKEFYLFNTHLSAGKNAPKRLNSVRTMLEEIPKITGEGARVFITGDFNATQNEGSIKALLSCPWLSDSKGISKTPPYGPAKTFNGFNISMGAPEGEQREKFIAAAMPIDFIFVSKNISVLRHAVITDSHYGKFPSDHLPVAVRAVLE